jgi:hypothetical protein
MNYHFKNIQAVDAPNKKMTPNKLKKVRTDFMDKYFSSSDELSEEDEKFNMKRGRTNPL